MTQNDSMTVQVSINGGTSWTTLKTIRGYYYNGVTPYITDPAFLTEYYDLTPYLSANFRLRFYPGATFANTIYFDDINISVATTTVISPIGGSPPTLVSGQTLLPGESMAVTFQVTVNDPLDPAATSIDNTATVTTDGGISQPASVSNPVIPPPVVSGPIYTLDTSISGTSTVIGGTITVYKNGVSIGTADGPGGRDLDPDGRLGARGWRQHHREGSLRRGHLRRVQHGHRDRHPADPQGVQTPAAIPSLPGRPLTYTIQIYNNTASTWTNVTTHRRPAHRIRPTWAGSSRSRCRADQDYYDRFTGIAYTGSNGTINWDRHPVDRNGRR